LKGKVPVATLTPMASAGDAGFCRYLFKRESYIKSCIKFLKIFNEAFKKTQCVYVLQLKNHLQMANGSKELYIKFLI
jgi:hypothetical protein